MLSGFIMDRMDSFKRARKCSSNGIVDFIEVSYKILIGNVDYTVAFNTMWPHPFMRIIYHYIVVPVVPPLCLQGHWLLSQSLMPLFHTNDLVHKFLNKFFSSSASGKIPVYPKKTRHSLYDIKSQGGGMHSPSEETSKILIVD